MKDLEQLFETVPTAQQVKEELSHTTIEAIKDFVNRVNQAMKDLTNPRFTLRAECSDIQLFHGIHKDKIKTILAQKGWHIKLVSNERNQIDPRESDYFEISMAQSQTNTHGSLRDNY